MDTAGTSAPAASCRRTVSSAMAVCDGGPWRSKRRRSKGTVLEGQLEAARCCKLQWCQWSCTKRMSLATSNVYWKGGFFQMWYSRITKQLEWRKCREQQGSIYQVISTEYLFVRIYQGFFAHSSQPLISCGYSVTGLPATEPREVVKAILKSAKTWGGFSGDAYTNDQMQTISI